MKLYSQKIRKVNVFFIQKSGKASYSTAKDYRPIRCFYVENYVDFRDYGDILPLYKNQSESILELILVVFLDIERDSMNFHTYIYTLVNIALHSRPVLTHIGPSICPRWFVGGDSSC